MLKRDMCNTKCYALMLFIVLIIELVVVILAFTMDPDVIYKSLDVPVWDYVTDPEIQLEVDTLQVTLNCCGSNSYLDYSGMEFTSNHSTTVVTAEDSGNNIVLVVPETCCATAGDVFCTRVRSTGCKDALINLIVQNGSVLGVLGVSVMFIQLLGMIFALLLARCIRKLKSEKALIEWKLKEQVILARQAFNEEQKQNPVVYIQPAETSLA